MVKRKNGIQNAVGEQADDNGDDVAEMYLYSGEVEFGMWLWTYSTCTPYHTDLYLL
jgi:hypothetical protein